MAISITRTRPDISSRRYARGQTDRQTNRHAYHHTLLPYQGRSKNDEQYSMYRPYSGCARAAVRAAAR